MQALNGGRGLRLQENTVRHALHSEHAYLELDQFGQDQFFKTAVMRVRDVQGHLNGVELESVLLGHLEHVQMNARILVPSESNVTNLSCVACFQQRRVRSFVVKDTVRIFEPENFMMLHEVDMVDIQTSQGFIQLPGSFLLRTSVNLCHKKRALTITIAKCFAHACLTCAFIVIPAVVHEVDALIYGCTNNANSQRFINMFQAEMPPSNSNSRHLFSGAAECAINHFNTSLIALINRRFRRVQRT